MGDIYSDVATLQAQMLDVQGDITTLEQALEQATISDTGWLNLPLADGIEAYGGSTPQYRKIGKLVAIRGAVKNVLAPGPIATLPVGYRPRYSVPYVQNTSMRSTTCAMYDRMIVGADGVIQVQAISDGAAFAADKWFPLHCTFLVD